MRINVAVPEAQVSKPVLDGVLEGVTRLNEALLKEGAVPTFDDAVEKVRWKPEPPGDEHFDHAAKVLSRGWGDCDDLAPWHAASLRVTGEDPEATAVVKRSGPSRWHAIVQRSDGSIDDPSREAGMGQKTSGVLGGALPLMAPIMGSQVSGVYVAHPQLSLRPIVEDSQVVGFECRVDMPWNQEALDGCGVSASHNQLAMTALHRAPVASQAIVGACRGAVRLGDESEYVDDDVIDRVEAIGHYVSGVPIEDIEDQYGPEHALAAQEVGKGFFKMLGRGLKKVALPLAKFGTQFIPGVGPLVSQGISMAQKGIEAADAASARKRARARASAAPAMSSYGGYGGGYGGGAIYTPSPDECIRILAQAHGMRVSGSEVGKFRFGKVFRHIVMPHTLITDRIKGPAGAVLDPLGRLTRGRRHRRHRRRHH